MLRIVLVVVLAALLSLNACVGSTGRMEENRHQADVHYKRAMAHLEGSNPSAALRELLKAVELDPKNSAIHVALAQAYQERRAYPEAETHYLRALALSDNDPLYQNNLANLYLSMENWDKAIDYFDLAAKNLLFDSNHIAMTGKGYAYLQKGDYDAALAAFREVALMDPDYAPAFYYQAEVYRETEDSRRERLALQETVKLAPELVQARYRLAVLLLREDNVSAARQQLETIINFAPDSDQGRDAVRLLGTLPE